MSNGCTDRSSKSRWRPPSRPSSKADTAACGATSPNLHDYRYEREHYGQKDGRAIPGRLRLRCRQDGPEDEPDLSAELGTARPTSRLAIRGCGAATPPSPVVFRHPQRGSIPLTA